MAWDILNDFQLYQTVPQECMDKYKNAIPAELYDIWQAYGFGSFMNGYLRFINPDDYVELLNASYFRADVAVPIMTTAFGDVITWEEGQLVTLVKYRYSTFDIVISDFDLFLDLLEDASFVNDVFTLDAYNEAVSKYGTLEYTQCFGYVPLLGLGGNEIVENLKKVKLKEHIAVMIDMVGGV